MKYCNARRIFTSIGFLLLLFLFTACGNSDTPEESTNTSVPPTETPIPPSETPAPTATLEPTDTNTPNPTNTPTSTEIPPTPTIDIQQQILAAKILVYEDTYLIGNYIKETLIEMGLTHTHVGDQVGELMNQLNSDTKWDLIIIGAEGRSGVQGEFWDLIIPLVADQNVALIYETWTLDFKYNGKVRKLLKPCGVEFQKDYPLALPLYAVDPSHPIFNKPNTEVSLERFVRFWSAQAGDYLKLSPDSSATMLMSTQKDSHVDFGVVANCFEERVIIQTFSNHDYRKEDVMLLWENYIMFTLESHFNTAP